MHLHKTVLAYPADTLTDLPKINTNHRPSKALCEPFQSVKHHRRRTDIPYQRPESLINGPSERPCVTALGTSFRRSHNTVQKEPVSKQAQAPGLRSVSSETKDRGFPQFNPAIISRALSRSLHRTRLTTSASGPPPPPPRGSYKIHLYGLYDADTVRHLHLQPSGPTGPRRVWASSTTPT